MHRTILAVVAVAAVCSCASMAHAAPADLLPGHGALMEGLSRALSHEASLGKVAAELKLGGGGPPPDWAFTVAAKTHLNHVVHCFADLMPPYLLNMAPWLDADHFDPTEVFAWIPAYQQTIPINGQIRYSTPCFGFNTMNVTWDYPNEIHINLQSSQQNSSCSSGMDFFLFGTIAGLHPVEVTSATTRQIIMKTSHYTAAQLQWTNRTGVRMFRFDSGPNATMQQLLSTINLFIPSELEKTLGPIVESRNAQFLKYQVFYDMDQRMVTDVALPDSAINDGDFLGIIRLDGLDPMLAWAMGAHTGHTAVALRFNGTLYVCESTAKSSYWPRGNVQKTPYDEWIKMAKAASYNVVHLPLSAAARAKFNVTAARQWFLNVAEGQPYGFFNLLFGWLDTLQDNYPGNLRAESHELLVGWVEVLAKPIADWLWNTALNQRLRTTNLTIAEISNTAFQRQMTFANLTTVVEQDSWRYFGNLSMVCDVLVCETYKAGGLFGNLTDQIQCTEFTNWDVYSLNIFDTTTPRPTACQVADPDLPFCQLLGNYRMTLPGYNTRPILPHMAETCTRGMPPHWDKSAGC